MSGVWRGALELFAQAGGPAGWGLERAWRCTWPWPLWTAGLAAAAAAAIAAAAYWRERPRAGLPAKIGLAALRIAVLAWIVTLMCGWIELRHRTEPPELAIVLDVSTSMNRQDAWDDARAAERAAQLLERAELQPPSRLNLAKALLLERDGRLLERLGRRYRLRWYLAGERTRPWEAGSEARSALAELKAEDQASRLGDALEDVLRRQRGRSTAAVVLLTDGVTTEGPTLSDAAEAARKRAVPLLLVGVGSPRPPRDVRIADATAQTGAFVGDLVVVDAAVRVTGPRDRPLTVRLRREADGAVLDQQTAPPPPEGQTARVRLTHRPVSPGPLALVVEAEPAPDEADQENNRRRVTVDVRDETIRVLLVQEQPSYEYRYLKSLLSRGVHLGGRTEKAVALSAVLQEADLDYAALDADARRGFPVSRDDLFAYDVVVFGDVNPGLLSDSALELLEEFVVQRGGGLILLAGPRYTPLAYRDTPLAKLSPVPLASVSAPPPGRPLSNGWRAGLTPLGAAWPPLQLADRPEQNADVWRAFPPLYWRLRAGEVKPGARVLVEARGAGGGPAPVVCLQFVGAGKVLLQLTDETYRWAKHPEGPRYYARYWLQTLRYMSRPRLLGASRVAELAADRAAYRAGEPVRLRVRFLDERRAPAEDDGVVAIVEHEGGRRRPVRLRRDGFSRSRFTALLTDLGPGRYRAWLASPSLDGSPPTARFAVAAPPSEQERLAMDAADLEAAARKADGRFYTIADAERLAAELPPGRPVRIESLPPKPLWNSPAAALLVLGLLTAEWIGRKRAGLL